MDQKELQAQARTTRNETLTKCDYYMLKDAPLTALGKMKMELYRKQLRDWPETKGFPDPATMPQPEDWSQYKPVADAVATAEPQEVKV